MTVRLKVSAKAIINETNKMIILNELHPSITLATNLLLIISLIDGSLGCGIIFAS